MKPLNSYEIKEMFPKPCFTELISSFRFKPLFRAFKSFFDRSHEICPRLKQKTFLTKIVTFKKEKVTNDVKESFYRLVGGKEVETSNFALNCF